MLLLAWLWDSPLFWCGILHINSHGQQQWAAYQVTLQYKSNIVCEIVGESIVRECDF